MALAIGRGFARPGCRAGPAVGDCLASGRCYRSRCDDFGLQRIGIRQRREIAPRDIHRFLSSFGQRRQIGPPFLQPGALRIEPVKRSTGCVTSPRRIATVTLRGSSGRASGFGGFAVLLDVRDGLVARRLRVCEGLFEARQLPIDFRSPVGAEKALRRRGTAADAYEAIPTPHHAVAGHQALADRKALARVLVGHANLREPAMQGFRGIYMIE